MPAKENFSAYILVPNANLLNIHVNMNREAGRALTLCLNGSFNSSLKFGTNSNDKVQDKCLCQKAATWKGIKVRGYPAIFGYLWHRDSRSDKSESLGRSWRNVGVVDQVVKSSREQATQRSETT